MVPVGCVVQLGPGPVFELEGGAAISGLVISVARVGGDGAEARGVGSGDLSDSHEFSGTYTSGTLCSCSSTIRGTSSSPTWWGLCSLSVCGPLNTVT